MINSFILNHCVTFDDAPHNWAGLYILDDADEAVPCYNTLAWAGWMEGAREAGRLRIAHDLDEGDAARQIEVSTIFMGVDHNFAGSTPILFETMAFRYNGNDREPIYDLTRRYSTRAEAMEGHQRVCQILMQATRESAKELPNQ